MMESVTITHVDGVKLGEAKWPAGTPVVPMGDVYMPERIQAWMRFPGDGDQPVLRVRLEIICGAPRFTKIEIESKQGGREVNGAEIGLVRDNLEFWRRTLVELTSQAHGDRDLAREPDWADSAVAAKSLQRVGRRRKATDDRHESIAALYRDNVAGKPIETIAAVYGVSHRTAARYVQEARANGHLPPTTRGKKQA